MYKSSTRAVYILPAPLGVLAVKYDSRIVFFFGRPIMQIYFLQKPSVSYSIIIIGYSKKTSLLLGVLDVMFERA
jgi:hypothetical protein